MLDIVTNVMYAMTKRSNNYLHILDCILIEKIGNHVSFSVTDLQTTISQEVTLKNQPDFDFTVAIYAEPLRKLLKELKRVFIRRRIL